MWVSSGLPKTPSLRSTPGQQRVSSTQVRRDGFRLQVKERHWLAVFRDWGRHREQDASPHSSPLSANVPPLLSWFQVKMTLGLGVVFFFKIKMGEEEGTQQARRETPLDSRNLRCPEILVLNTSKSSLWKFQCGQISSIAASLCQPPTRWKVVEWKFKYPKNVFHLSTIFHSGSRQYGLPGLQAAEAERPHIIWKGTWKTSPKSKLCQKVSTSRPIQRKKCQFHRVGKLTWTDCIIP